MHVVCLGVESYSGWSNHILTIQTGGSVIIPCHYDKKYTRQKKYWFSEIDTSKTYTNTTDENLSVIDDPDQSLFTVTMRNLQNKHTGLYYCVVYIEGKLNVTHEVYIKVQSGKRFCIHVNHILMLNVFSSSQMTGVCVCSAPDVSVVNSSVSGHEGGDISVQCFYSSGYQNKSNSGADIKIRAVTQWGGLTHPRIHQCR